MKYCLVLIFSFFLVGVHARVEDHFDDGDFSVSPVWIGDNSEFNVNPALQLQLNATAAGFSYLSVPANLSTLDSCEWRFFIRLNFSPSSSNYAKVYLSSDASNLEQPLNGYFLRFGESLSNDAIELFRQYGTTITSICRGVNGNVANAFSVGVQVIRNSSGTWTLATDYSGGTNYTIEATGNDITYNNASFIGVGCEYTSGNINKFYFDDFYAGPIIHDTILPEVESVAVESDSVLLLTFSEKIDSNTLNNLSHYSVDQGIGNPVSLSVDSLNQLLASLRFQTHFLSGVNYQLAVDGLMDLYQNTMLPKSFAFSYYPVSEATINDVVITEVYFEPSSSSPLPNAEYIEVYNRKDSSINLSGWTITDGTSDGQISDFRLDANSYAVLYDESDSAEFSNVLHAIPVHDFPALNNDVGDHIKLRNANLVAISELSFSDAYYHDNGKNDGGWSIERIDADFECINENNWKASTANMHGTPGAVNSVNGIFQDQVSPFVESAFLTDSFSVKIFFSEAVSASAGDVNNYRVAGEDGTLILPVSISTSAEFDTVVLHFSLPFEGKIYSLQVSNNVVDCPGNAIDSSQPIRFGFPEKANYNDVIINEILFNPFDDGTDFVEIYNRSEKIIDLKDWTINECDYKDSSYVREDGKVSTESRLIFPGEYLVLSEEESKVKNHYTILDKHAFLNVSSLPDFNSDEGRVKIYNSEGVLIDALTYNEDMHFPLIVDPKGISLERISEQAINNNINWHSAAATAGFATPGYRNSQWLGKSSGIDEVSLGEEVFSPDNDGFLDVLSVHYRYPQTGTVLSLNVYDYNGMHVKTLLSGETIGREGVITWDGLNDEMNISPSGIYILLANSFDLQGNNKTFKKAVFLTRKF